MRKLIILNHKMNLEYDEVIPYIEKINQIETTHDLVVCPSNLYLTEFMNHCSWGVGAQNVSEKMNGNYTGEVSVLQLKSIGVEYSLIGHYERKKYFHETEEQIQKKLNACLDANIVPILCFGETGKEEDIFNSLDTLLSGIERIDFIIFAYEPLKVAKNYSIEEIQEKIEKIYDYLKSRYHVAPNLIYGGGISKKDIQQVLKIEKLHGILIGKISSQIDKVEKLIASI